MEAVLCMQPLFLCLKLIIALAALGKTFNELPNCLKACTLILLNLVVLYPTKIFLYASKNDR